jgi:hypothetical protein
MKRRVLTSGALAPSTYRQNIDFNVGDLAYFLTTRSIKQKIKKYEKILELGIGGDGCHCQCM